MKHPFTWLVICVLTVYFSSILIQPSASNWFLDWNLREVFNETYLNYKREYESGIEQQIPNDDLIQLTKKISITYTNTRFLFSVFSRLPHLRILEFLHLPNFAILYPFCFSYILFPFLFTSVSVPKLKLNYMFSVYIYFYRFSEMCIHVIFFAIFASFSPFGIMLNSSAEIAFVFKIINP